MGSLFAGRSPKEKILILAVIYLLIGSFLAWNIILKSHQAKIRGVGISRSAEADKERLLKQVSATQTKIGTYRKVFSEKNETSWLIDEINRMAGESGLTLLSVDPAPVSDRTENYQKLSVRIETTGSFHQLGNFVSQTENHPVMIRVSNVRIDPGRPGADAEKGQHIQMVLSVFYPVK